MDDAGVELENLGPNKSVKVKLLCESHVWVRVHGYSQWTCGSHERSISSTLEYITGISLFQPTLIESQVKLNNYHTKCRIYLNCPKKNSTSKFLVELGCAIAMITPVLEAVMDNF